MTAALFLRQHVHLAVEVGVRMDGTGLCDYLAALHFLTGDTTQQHADVVACDGLIQQLPEHFHTGDHGGLLLIGQTHDLNGILYLYGTALYTAGSHGAAAGDGEYVFHGHKEGLIGGTLGSGDVGVYSVHQLENALALGAFLGVGAIGQGFQSSQSGTADHGDVVAGEIIGAQQFADLHLDQLQQLVVIYLVHLVHEHDDVGNAYLTGQQDMLAGLGHGAFGGVHQQNDAVDHFQNALHLAAEIGVTRGVHDVDLVVLIMHGSVLCQNGDAALPLQIAGVHDPLHSGLIFPVNTALLEHFVHQGGLAMVNVGDDGNVANFILRYHEKVSF